MRDQGDVNDRLEAAPSLGLLFLAATLIAAVFLAYQPAWHGGPIWDDKAHVTPPDLRSWQGLARIWSDLGATQQYYPLLHSAFWVQHRLWGDATLGYHLVNVALHGVAALLVFLVLRRLAVPGALLAAAIFALHPVHVESVAWISELKNTLSAVFYLGAMLAYLRFDRTRRAAPYLASLALFVLGLLAKTVTATLPAALLVIFWWQRGRLSWRRDALPVAPMFVLGLAAGVFTAWIERTMIGAEGADFAMTPVERLLLAGRAPWFYLGKLLLPVKLLFIYPRWAIDQAVAWQYLFPTATLLAIGALWALRRRSRAPLAGALYFGGTLFPVLGFFNVYPFVYSYVADHFQYLASLGVIAPVAGGLAMLAARNRPAWRPATRAAAVALVATLAALTWRQSRMYADVETLYRTTIAGNPGGWMAYNNLGNHLLERGRIDDAADLYRSALALKPDLPEAANNLGWALATRGRVDEAIPWYQAALRLRPAYVEAHNNLGLALAARGRLDEAVAHYRQALSVRPDVPEPHNNLGLALAQQGRLGEAINHFDRALRLRPSFTQARVNLGQARAALQRARREPDETRPGER